MGRFTAWDDPLVDQTVEHHLREIVTAIRAQLSPDSIILRGSFARGEGSVVTDGDQLTFLSDYELVVVSPHVSDRSVLRTVSRDLTARLGVEISISRLHPQDVLAGMAAGHTIAMYEMQNGGMVLWGEPVLGRVPATDPRSLDLWSALRLLLNRMAESLGNESAADDLETLRWITKTALACAESLLLACGQYHYSYAERGRRFADLLPHLDGLSERASGMRELVRSATAFKLRPSLDCYPAPLHPIQQALKQACDATLRYLIREYLGFSFDTYAEFPGQYQRNMLAQNKIRAHPIPLLPTILSQNSYLILRSLHDQHRLPLRLIGMGSCPAHHVVYSVVPLVFLGGRDREMTETRRQLGRVLALKRFKSHGSNEREYLQTCTTRAWQDFCYGLWERS
ncbi:MAG: nucleotidyltransferase domain-containing protein [Chloroflexi bacterium]|nr:nucleotidyltransferase domain-containing protein [Chloroflexota bacterium]